MPILLEVCVTSVKSALAAAAGGAQRLELCLNLAEGGVTPPASLLKDVRQAVEININVMVRPRPGNFCYTDQEVETMKEEILQAKTLGANGVVLGLLNEDRTISTKQIKQLIGLAHPLSVTFHRAFDETPFPHRAIEEIIEAGANHILTSGQKVTAFEGKTLIRSLVAAGGNRIRILPGAGISEDNAAELVRETGVREIHVARAVQKNGETDAELVRQLLDSIESPKGNH